MDTDPGGQRLAGLTHEQIEWHIRQAHRLRNEAIAEGARRLILALRAMLHTAHPQGAASRRRIRQVAGH